MEYGYFFLFLPLENLFYRTRTHIFIVMKKTFITFITALACFCSCSINIDFDAYTTGGADIDDEVRNLDIFWDNGLVQIRYWAENYFSFYEEAGGMRPISDPMCYYYDGKNLRIRDARHGTNSSKTLYLFVPAGAMLQNVDIETVNAAIDVDLDCNSLDIETVYGPVVFSTQNNKMASIDIENDYEDTEIILPADIYGFKCVFDSNGSLISGFLPTIPSPSMDWYTYKSGYTNIYFESGYGNLIISVNKD